MKKLTKRALRDLIREAFDAQWESEENDAMREADVSFARIRSATELTIYSGNEEFVIRVSKPRRAK